MKNSIWLEENDLYQLEPLTDEMVKKAEEKFNIKLPNKYIEILKQQNGGVIKFDSFPTEIPTSWADDHINVDHILGIGEETGILESEYLIKEWGLPRNIVLISGDGHSWIALDYRKTKVDPPVIYIDLDEDQIIKIAPKFEVFLKGLMNW
ncbi:SMI1/KNR4 family protein [Gottfriedia acidiceleris]|uniref:SMI1/KNR4 family protein n=1 Tax=Gottfriedia acidiceleris TaxID=371036 RepID=UPI00101C2900|nr:SMI1/KNR4 family protein [Gottfriedia acidiceleris]